mgnify:CR=1 FL=1
MSLIFYQSLFNDQKTLSKENPPFTFTIVKFISRKFLTYLLKFFKRGVLINKIGSS